MTIMSTFEQTVQINYYAEERYVLHIILRYSNMKILFLLKSNEHKDKVEANTI